MVILFWGTILLLISFAIHLIVWRIRLPRKQTRALVIIFYGVFSLWCLLMQNQLFFGSESKLYLLNQYSEYAHIFLYFCFVTFVYIGVYTLIEADSPSLLIIYHIHAAGEEGLQKDALYESLNDNILVVPRVNDLLRDEMATLENGTYKITPKGIFMVRILLFHRWIMKVDHKGG